MIATAHPASVQFIGQLVRKGKISKDDLLGLARFLNGQKAARHQWPGVAVFDVLREILEDGIVEDFELVGLTLVLHGIHVICEGDGGIRSA